MHTLIHTTLNTCTHLYTHLFKEKMYNSCTCSVQVHWSVEVRNKNIFLLLTFSKLEGVHKNELRYYHEAEAKSLEHTHTHTHTHTHKFFPFT